MVHPRLSRMDQFHTCRDTHKVIWAVGMSDAFVRVGVKPSKDHSTLSWRERDHIFLGKKKKNKKQAMFNCYRYSEFSAWSRGKKVAKTYDKVPKGTWVPWVTMSWVTVAASAQRQSRIGAHFEPACWQGISPNDSTSVLRGFAANPSFPQVQKEVWNVLFLFAAQQFGTRSSQTPIWYPGSWSEIQNFTSLGD